MSSSSSSSAPSRRSQPDVYTTTHRRSFRQALKAGSRALLLLLRFLYNLLKLNDAVKDPIHRNRSVDRYRPAIAEANQFGEKDSYQVIISYH